MSEGKQTRVVAVLDDMFFSSKIREAAKSTGTNVEFDAHFDELFEVFRSDAWAIFPETKGVLESLKEKDYKLGIISNFDSRVYDVMNAFEKAFFRVSGFGSPPYFLATEA